MALTAADAAAFARCIAGGGVAVFPADTVYGLACDPDSVAAVDRLYALKGRRPDKPAAVMFFALEPALAALPALGPRTECALRTLLPGPVTLLLPDDGGTLGLRVPAFGPSVAALEGVRRPVLQSSANLSGAPDARVLSAVPEAIRAHADLVLDGGELPGTPSTVVDLREWELDARVAIVREGAVSAADIRARLQSAA